MRQSFTHRVRPRTKTRSETRRCTRLGKATMVFRYEGPHRVDSKSGLVHSVVADGGQTFMIVSLFQSCCSRGWTRVWGDSAYLGQKLAIRKACSACQGTYETIGPAAIRLLTAAEKAINRTKSRVRAKVEHPSLRRQAAVGLLPRSVIAVLPRTTANATGLFVAPFALSNSLVSRNKLSTLATGVGVSRSEVRGPSGARIGSGRSENVNRAT